MDYEKKYKEALERMRYVVIDPKNENMLQAIKETVFPELKESEDERIRKEIIEHCRNTRCVTEERAERIAKWIAWLEKQGQVKDFAISQHENKMCKENSDSLTSEDKKIEQKPAWSEEDEEMCQETIGWFEKKCFPYALEKDNPARESIKWLKSLKQRIKKEAV